jgi:hypothetical protein
MGYSSAMKIVFGIMFALCVAVSAFTRDPWKTVLFVHRTIRDYLLLLVRRLQVWKPQMEKR